jgi:uncharacterized protein
VREFLEFVIRGLVDYPDDVIVTQGEDGEYLFFLLTMRPGDVGKVIGRNGHTINAIRSVLAAVAAKSGKKVAVDIVEPKQGGGVPVPERSPDSDPSAQG